jgi:hypothetical protein
MPTASNFRLNIDFARRRKIMSGEIFPVVRAPGRIFRRPGNLCRGSGQITPLFEKSAGEKSRKSAEILCAIPAQQMANKDERQP